VSPCNPIQFTVNSDFINNNSAAGTFGVAQISRTPASGTPITNLGGQTYGPFCSSSYFECSSYVGQVTDYHHATTGYPLIYGIRFANNTAGSVGGLNLPDNYAYAQVIELMG
jgi:hypothetical protein